MTGSLQLDREKGVLGKIRSHKGCEHLDLALVILSTAPHATFDMYICSHADAVSALQQRGCMPSDLFACVHAAAAGATEGAASMHGTTQPSVEQRKALHLLSPLLSRPAPHPFVPRAHSPMHTGARHLKHLHATHVSCHEFLPTLKWSAHQKTALVSRG